MAHEDTHDTQRHRRSSNELHPAIYWMLAGFAGWMVLAAWFAFGGWGYSTFLLAVVTYFFVIAGAIPFLIWRTWRRNAPDSKPSGIPFSEWWRGEVETWQGRVEGWDAAIEVLLPLGIAALGMTLIGIVFRITAGG